MCNQNTEPTVEKEFELKNPLVYCLYRPACSSRLINSICATGNTSSLLQTDAIVAFNTHLQFHRFWVITISTLIEFPI